MTRHLPILPNDAGYWRGLASASPSPSPSPSDDPSSPEIETEDDSTLSRRQFIQLAIASAAAAACVKEPPEKVLPFVHSPAGMIPGKPLHYATSVTVGGLAQALLGTSYEGRPTKIEGNPEHPVSRGATSALEQALILSLYDPQRARTIEKRRGAQTWLEFQTAMAEARTRLGRGRGLRFLVEPSSSPLLGHLRSEIQERMPESRFCTYAPVSSDARYDGTRIAFGEPLECHIDLERADLIVSLDADFLGAGQAPLSLARQFAARRMPERMNRLYVAETTFTLTGMMSDHRFRLAEADIGTLAFSLLAALSTGGALLANGLPFLPALVKDLDRHRKRGVVLAGIRQPAAVHAAAAALNHLLGSEAVSYTAPLIEPQSGPASLGALISEMRAGAVDTLVMTAYNPAYSAPVELGFADALAKVPHAIYHAAYRDETAPRCEWFVPAAHPLESWGDGRSADGTVTFAQPLIRPLMGGVTSAELYAAMLGLADRGPYELLRGFWRAEAPKGELFDAWWERTIQKGFLADSAPTREKVELDLDAVRSAVTRERERAARSAIGLELHFLPDAKVYDGRFSNNAWLQELPDPVTKITWDNALLMSSRTAGELGVRNEDLVEVAAGEHHLVAPVWILPGQADRCLSIALGYGRAGSEEIARDVGVNAYPLRTSDAPWVLHGVAVRKATRRDPLGIRRERHRFAVTQEHGTMDGRPLALESPVASFRPGITEELRGEQPQLYGTRPPGPYRWGMSIDLSRCTGCSACVLACQSENNIPVVGKEGVRKSREMHWLRIDRYFHGGADDPTAMVQPVACVHCELAPCEYVCPVNATVHSDEGLNEMVYNRCVGTRYCSNNCPYKVRRFNFFNYTSHKSPIEKLASNPEVTVRSRGVMEKCTYCVQRIERTRIETRIEGRPIADGDIKTACQQVCPSQAIVFGTLSDAKAEVTRLHADERRYDLLHELGTRPRTAYLVRLRNPNPELA